MNKVLRLATTIALTSAPVAITTAAPTINGLTITWPDDGWYQVLSSVDYSEICGGESSCDVDPGTYIVINHSTGERYENVEVVRALAAQPPIIVTGNTISWQDDGWYQVLRSDNYSEICGGESSCDVDPGNYIVINHSTGDRYEDVEVVGSVNNQSPISISGNTISWPDDGWYQVQSTADYSTVCEGVRQCDVDNGTYHVINHSTGDRFENVVVEAEANIDDESVSGIFPPGQIPMPVKASLDKAAPYFLESMAGYQLDQVFDYVDALTDEIIATSVASTELEPSIRVIRHLGESVEVSMRTVEYACSGGGSVVRQYEESLIESNGNPRADTIGYRSFKNCQIDTDSENFLRGNHLLEGVIFDSTISTVSNELTYNSSRILFNYLKLRAPEGNEVSVDGEVITSVSESDVKRTSRTVTIDRYREIRAVELIRDISSVDFTFTKLTKNNGDYQTTDIDVAGKIIGAATNRELITISTDETLASRISSPLAEVPTWLGDTRFTGRLNIMSANNTQMSITASPHLTTDFTAPLRYDFSVINPDNENTTGSGLPFPEFAVSAPKTPFYPRNPNVIRDTTPVSPLYAPGEIPIPTSTRLVESAPYILESFAGYQLEQLQVYMEQLTDTIVSTAISRTALEPEVREVQLSDDVQVAIFNRTKYNCSGGGALIHEQFSSYINYSDFPEDRDFNRWLYSDCQVDTGSEGLLSGMHQIDGEMSLYKQTSSADILLDIETFTIGQAELNEQAITYAGFSLVAPDEYSVAIDARANVYLLDPEYPDTRRNVDFGNYVEVHKGAVIRSIKDAEFYFDSSTFSFAQGNDESLGFRAIGIFSGTASKGDDVSLSSLFRFYRRRILDETTNTFGVYGSVFGGEMQLAATDGAQLNIMARPDIREPVDRDVIVPLLFDYALLSPDGNILVGEAVPFPSFTVVAPLIPFFKQ